MLGKCQEPTTQVVCTYENNKKPRVYRQNRESTDGIASLQMESRVYRQNCESTDGIASLQMELRVYRQNRESTDGIASLQTELRVYSSFASDPRVDSIVLFLVLSALDTS